MPHEPYHPAQAVEIDAETDADEDTGDDRRHDEGEQRAADDALLDELAALRPMEYDHRRDAAAVRLGIRVTTLDREMDMRRPKTANTKGQGRALQLTDPEPWHEPVDGAELLDSLVVTFKRYLVLPKYAADVLALWTLHAHTFESSYHTPRLAITAPERQCGKTVLLDVLESLTPRSIRTENCTTAVLFRLVDASKPTLLVDEFDTFLTRNDELRGALNAGHRRGGQHLRCEGDGNELRAFKTYGPAAIAGIGKLPPTLADRSIPIVMRRARPDEEIQAFRADRAHREKELASRAARWGADNFQALCDADPDLPGALFNRSGDNWRPLLAIADRCGGEWPRIARGAAEHLTSDGADDVSIGEMLLADIRDIFEERGVGCLPSTDIIASLIQMEDRPWPEFGRVNKKPITAAGLGRLLSRFGIKPDKWREGSLTVRGYSRTDFDDAFSRYLPSQLDTTATALKDNGNLEFQSATDISFVAGAVGPKAAENKGCGVVADGKGGNGGKGTDLAGIPSSPQENRLPPAAPATSTAPGDDEAEKVWQNEI